MSNNNSILFLLNLKDTNINFYPEDDCVSYDDVRGVESMIISGSLTYSAPDHCPVCGTVNEHNDIIKHGTKTSLITLPKVSGYPAYLKLKKQRFFCKHCHSTFTAKTDIVDPNCFISKNTKLSIVLESKKKSSEKDIASDHSVSHATVNSIIHKLYEGFIVRKNYLPPHLCFDEFKSVKSVDHAMSFLFLDAQSGKIINILPDRRKNALIKYFKSYSLKARKSVETVCMDMYSPYFSVVKECFPNAKIILDRFHIVQLISRALNKTRISLMNKDKEHYNKLKRYWKLILKSEDELDDTQYHKMTCFSPLMREIDVVHYLTDLDPEFKATYDLYQELLSALRKRNPDRFIQCLNNADSNISKPMKTAVNSLLNCQEYVINALTYSYSNGIIEGTNNLIKVIKRIAFGYRSFVQFKTRIFLISNTLVPCKL